MMHSQMLEKLQEKSKIGVGKDMKTKFANYKVPEDKTSYFVLSLFPTK